MAENNRVSSPVLLGKTGPRVFPIGLGLMGFSGIYGSVDENDALKAILHAIDRGITLLDTGDFYGMGRNELLLRRALEARRNRRDRLQVSVKFGAMRGPDHSWGGIDTRPTAVKNFLSYSLARLGIESIDIYRPARLDPAVPIEETVGALAEVRKAGFIRHIGLSEVGAETIRRAHAVHPIADLQIEYAIVSRNPEKAIFPALRELGISATLYGVLSRGLLSGSRPQGKGDSRAHLPRFAEQVRSQNQNVVERVADFARDRHMTSSQLLIQYVRTKQPGFVPIIGARTVAQVDDILDALDKKLEKGDIDALEKLIPADAIAGTRYAPEQMKALDSER